MILLMLVPLLDAGASLAWVLTELAQDSTVTAALPWVSAAGIVFA